MIPQATVDFLDRLADDRVSKTIRTAAGFGRTVHVSDLMLAALFHGGSHLSGVFAKCLGNTWTLTDAIRTLAAAGLALKPAPELSPFSPQALAAVQEFRQLASGDEANATLDRFVQILIQHWSAADQSRFPFFDIPHLQIALRESVDGPATQSQQNGDAVPSDQAPAEQFVMPDALGPWENLTQRARMAPSGIRFPFDNEPEYEQTFDLIARGLHRRESRHVFLVAERGVGEKTVLAEFARRAAGGQYPFLAGKQFVLIDCRHVGPEESKSYLAEIMSRLGSRPDVIACLVGFSALLVNDRLSTNRPMLLAGLRSIQCQLIATLEARDFRQYIADDPELRDQFKRVDLNEPDVETALKILNHYADGLQARFRVTIAPEAVRQAAVLTSNYCLNDRLPGKALKVLLRVCEDLDFDRDQLHSTRTTVTVEDVVRVVSETSGVPPETLNGIAERSDYERSLGQEIVGQDHVIREVAAELGLIKAGMTDPSKPATVLMFIGQTGTGKTELAKALARFYSTSKQLKTYTLGNCIEPHSVATIIGVPPGYVGNDQGGRLINELNADPYCVFLLDEADKAHPDVLQPFLNLFDEGWVTDQRGVKAYANNAIFILTTNVGQKMLGDFIRAKHSREEIAEKMKEGLSQIKHSKSNRPVFTPEFLARIKRILVFNPLDRDAMEGICRKLIGERQHYWKTRRSRTLIVPEPLIKYLAEQAHVKNDKSQGKEGGRIVHKLMSEYVETAIQREVTSRPQDFRECNAIELEFTPPDADDPTSRPQVAVTFTRLAARTMPV